MARLGGPRRKRKSRFTKSSNEKGKINLKGYLHQYSVGDKVTLSIEPAIHKGSYHPRFIGKMGTIIAKKGTCYQVKIKDFEKEKTLIVHPVHMRRT